MIPVVTTRPGEVPGSAAERAYDERETTASVCDILNRHPAVGLAVGVVHDGRLQFFYRQGLADIASQTPITEDTVFRIASITKTFTAIAVMQLWEQGLVDLDAPANDYLYAYQLVPADSSFRPATVRHLLTHTAGIPQVLHPSDWLRPERGEVFKAGQLPTLAEYYRGGLRVVVEPGTTFAYTDHGFATLGQIVEDVSGEPLDRYFREHLFAPLGMTDTDLLRSERVKGRLATGYDLGHNGAEAITDREWLGRGGGGTYSSTRDMARYVAALLGGGANEHGSVLQPATLATMFAPHYQPDLCLPGMGLGFFRYDSGGHLVVSHEGILPGFNSALVVAPDDGLGVIACTNGSSGAMAWLPFELGRLLRHLLDIPNEVVRSDVPHHPEIWDELCGRYRLPPRIADLRGRVVMGSGVQVFVRAGRLMLRVLTPVPALYRGLPLHPDDHTDPYVFRLDLSRFGMSTVRLVFAHEAGGGVMAIHTDLGSQPASLYRQPKAKSARLLAPLQWVPERWRPFGGRVEGNTRRW
jgi:CubicO group peptidase (beta-lactamase class C family)